MLEPSFLIPFICVCLSISWMACAKVVCERNYDDVAVFDTALWPGIQGLSFLCIIAAIIIVIIKASFLAALCYLGIAIGCIVIGQFTVSLLLVAIFGYQFLGAILPPLSCIGTAIWMFTQVGSLS